LTNQRFEDNGLGIAAGDSGRARITLNPGDYGKFKVPTLRNVALTAPYMHDGRFRSLEEVVAHYSAGGIGSDLQHESVRPLQLTEHERSDLIAFLHALTDDFIVAGSDRIDQE
jgi:cytochrome c peroxidase